jgi:hypothetical protein
MRLGIACTARTILTDIPRIPGPSSAIFRLIEANHKEIRPQPTSLAAKSSGFLPRRAETRGLAFITAHLCRRRLSYLTRSPGHAGAVSARSRAISDRISWNICRGTATSAIWNVSSDRD